jgi:hypothetical protein
MVKSRENGANRGVVPEEKEPFLAQLASTNRIGGVL